MHATVVTIEGQGGHGVGAGGLGEPNTKKESAEKKNTLQKKILLLLLSGFEPVTF